MSGELLVTGMPRSGTTLLVSLLNRQEDIVALAEPFQLKADLPREAAADQVVRWMQEYRAAALAGAPIPTKHVGGVIPDNWVEPPQPQGQLRKVVEERGALRFDKPLTEDFTLVVKHPAEFTSLADLLVARLPLFAMVRDPLAVLAAWQTVDMPVQRGRMPMLECFAPVAVRDRLAGIDNPLERQVALIEFQLQAYLEVLPRERVLRYEDLVADPGAVLGHFCQAPAEVPALAAEDPLARYRGVDFARIAAPLRRLLPLIEQFYPDFAVRWDAYLRGGVGGAVLAPAHIPEAREEPVAPAPGPFPPDDPRVFVMGAFIPAGGTRMAYEIGQVAQDALGLACTAVLCGNEIPEASYFDYPAQLDTVRREELALLVRPQDILVCNPSFSDGRVGLACTCRKLMYVQGFNTFSVLDAWFDRHVAVSGFVQDYLANVYSLEAPIIRPFVTADPGQGKFWWSRPAKSVWFYLKGNPSQQMALLDRLRAELAQLDRLLADQIDWEGSVLWSGSHKQAELWEKLAERRYFVSLSVAEGFGLVPLEAMALGTTVLGLDGFGGRDYMRSGSNCRVQPYPNIAGVALDIVDCFRNPERAAALAQRGPATARRYSRAQFHAAWKPELERLLH